MRWCCGAPGGSAAVTACWSSSPRRAACTSSPARRPCSRTGWATVVRSVSAASGWSSIPITDRSSGTRRPARRSVRTAPRAISSLWANTAVGGERRPSRRAIPSAPPSPSAGTVTTRSPSGSTPASRSAASHAARRPSGTSGVLHVDHPDPPVPEVQEVVHGLAPGRVLVDGDRRVRRDPPARGDHGHVEGRETGVLGLVHRREHHDGVHLAPRRQAGEERRALLGPADAEEDEVEVGGAQLALEALEQLAEEPPRRVRDEDGDPARRPAREPGGLGGGDVVQLLGGGADAFPGGRRDVGSVAQGARRRRRRDPGVAGHVVEGHARRRAQRRLRTTRVPGHRRSMARGWKRFQTSAGALHPHVRAHCPKRHRVIRRSL